MISAVIFDVDGTLLDTERLYVDAWRTACLEQGYILPEDTIRRTRAVDRTVAAQIFKEALGKDFDYQATYLRRVELAEAEIEARRKPLIKPGAVELLDYLDAHGIRKAVATMTSGEKTRRHLDAAGLLCRFSIAVTGDMVQNGKPDPEIFLTTAALLGVSPEQCAVCEDSYAGLEAARRAGMLPIMIPDYVPARDTERAFAEILPSLSEVIGLIQEANHE